jgi:hypothetical protein
MATAVVAESCYDPRSDEVEAVDARLVALARAGAPLRRALARVAGELLRRRTWEPLGFARAGDYARERPGLSARELCDLAHVDAALAKLPAIDAALSEGRLGWTKARLLCRVATPEDEGRWLAAAATLSAAALARQVRAIDVGSLEAGGTEASDDDAEREVLRIRVPKRVKTKWGDVKRTVRRVAGEWLPNETCVELVAAEVLSAIRLEVAPEALPPLAQRVRSAVADPELVPAPLPALPAPPPPSPFLQALVAGLEGADPRELDRRLCRAAALERGLLARIGPLLLALVDARSPSQLGYRSLDAYARERLGISPRKARALLRLERACAISPALREAWRAGALTVSQAELLVPLVLEPESEPFQPAWIERAAGVTLRRLGDDVEHALASGSFDPALLPELPAGLQIGAQPTGGEETIPAAPETDVWVAHVPAEVGRLFRACLCTVARRLGTPAAALEAMFDHFNDTWLCSTPRAYRVFERDGYRCTVPGCTAQRNLHAHHVLFRSRGGRDDLANLVTLCAAHHQRGVHRGVIRISGRAPEALVFELPLCVYRSGDRAVRAGATSAAGSTAG